MKQLHDFHQYLGDGRPHNLDAIQCVNLTDTHDLRRELLRSNPATIDLLTEPFATLADPSSRVPPCQLFSADELMGTIEPLPGARLSCGGLMSVSADDPDISADDRRHYVSHDLLSPVVDKLAAALGEPISAEDAASMPTGTMEALERLNAAVSTLHRQIRR